MSETEARQTIDTQEVKRLARELGADLAGVASAEDFAEAAPGCRPRDLFPMANSVIVIAKRIPFAAATPYPSIGAMEFGEYIPENFLNEACYRLSLHLEDKGFLSGATPSGRDITNFRVEEEDPEPRVFLRGSFDLRLAAVKAGLGHIGANNCLITPQYGSRVRLGAVLTEANLEPDPPNQYGVIPEFCRECGFRCVEACPANALPGDGTVDHYRCMVIRPDLVAPEKALAHFRKLFRGKPMIMAAKGLSYTDSPPHPCSTCIALCPMDQGRDFTDKPFHREYWSDEDALKVIDPALLENPQDG